ncbi:MAG: BREX system ATP-binding protein BrxD [Deltaproteobacteria bacterium]|nr:BREX system ATP-binding protein BrxD [Deltaproteobacteria bacterium]
MSELTTRDIAHVFESLRKGLVPERGIEAFAVGIDARRGELSRQMDLAKDGEGTIKFLRGGYGCGKTFTARLAVLDAQQRKFVTSFVVVSDNDLHFHRFDDVYRRVMTELGTASCARGALSDVLDRWIGQVEDTLIEGGADPDAKDFDQKVRARLEADLDAATRGAVPQDFVRVVQAIFDLKQKGNAADAGSLISWLCGSENVSAGIKRDAGIKGEIGSRDALSYLRGVLEIVKAAGYAGMVIVIDEAETILRMRKDSRHKSLNGIRQIADAAGSYPGLLWLFTGTPDFFDSRHGVAGLAPLHDRIHFKKDGKFASLRQAQLELTPFDAERLRAVALRLRELFPAADRQRFERAVSGAFIDRLVDEVTAGFKGDVGVVPRQFLRELVTQMDLVDEQAEYDPMTHYGFKMPTPPTLRVEEQSALSGTALVAADADEALVPKEDVW